MKFAPATKRARGAGLPSLVRSSKFEVQGSKFPTTRTSAFTLAEVLAALVFMAIVIPVAIEGLSIASRAGEVAARKGEAALIAERVLNTSIVTTNWNQSVQNGSEGKGTPHEFRWTLRNDAWNEDANQTAMRLLSVEVTFAAQGRDYSVRLSTLADNSSPTSTGSVQ
jgi:type II secretory pathway pseudopilin PulG